MAYTVNERIEQLRQKMRERKIDIYIVPTADFHESEYVGDYFMARKYITGFTGSSGVAVITADEANLWTDGRYFVQAEGELAGSCVILRKMGEEGVPTIEEYLGKTLPKEGCIGFDGRVINASLGKGYKEIAKNKKGRLYTDEDLVGMIWEDRPSLSCKPVWILPMEYAGKSSAEKISEIRKEMKKQGCSKVLVSSLYDIAWILNVRGDDISYVPVVLSYLSIEEDRCVWFVQKDAVSEEVRLYIKSLGVSLRDYEDFYSYAAGLSGEKIWIEKGVLNYKAYRKISSTCTKYDAPVPSVLMRSIKNKVELENTRKAHRADALAMIEFMYWLKTNIGTIPMTELSAAEKLAELRAKQDGFLDLSFCTIPAYGPHGAMCHYHVTPASDAELKPEGLFLVDSGGHYLDGTTDITRTFALGPLTRDMKEKFTLVVRSNRNLAAAKFRYGCNGMNLDMIARAPFWESGLDFNHGTGHGVGHILNVHEGPQEFRWRLRPTTDVSVPFEEGTITTDEPGIYLEGEFGVRIEDELICLKGEKTKFGQFMYFEDITYVPIDLDAILPELMSDKERKLLNDYHENVYQTMSPYLDDTLKAWLREVTRPV